MARRLVLVQNHSRSRWNIPLDQGPMAGSIRPNHLQLSGVRAVNTESRPSSRSVTKPMPTIGPLKLKLQVLCGDVLALGPGKADLLEAIARAGSISAAGRELDMSYRRAWILVDEMNHCWSERLVETQSGGGNRSGARLTDCGRQVLSAFRNLEAALANAAEGADFEILKGLLRAVPSGIPGAA